jgi:hypothetical protein
MTTNLPTASRQYIHYNPERTDYSVTIDELARLETAGSNFWKDLCLVCASLGVSCEINAIAGTPSPFVLSVPLFLNYLFGTLGIVLAVAFGIAWSKTYTGFGKIIEEIKNKPKMEIVPSTTNVGALPAATLVPSPPAGMTPSTGGGGRAG